MKSDLHLLLSREPFARMKGLFRPPIPPTIQQIEEAFESVDNLEVMRFTAFYLSLQKIVSRDYERQIRLEQEKRDKERETLMRADPAQRSSWRPRREPDESSLWWMNY